MHELYHFGFYLVAPQKFLFFPCNGERERESVKYKRLIYNSRFFPLSFLLFLSMEIGVGIETLDGSMVNPMVSWITSSSLGASLVDHLSTIRFHAILCLLFFSQPPHFHRVMTRLFRGEKSRLKRWLEFQRGGEGQGISTFAWRIVRFSRLFQLSVWNARRDSWIHGRNVVE